VAPEYIPHHLDPLGGRHIRQPHEAAVRRACAEDQRAEVRVNRHENSVLLLRELEKSSVARVGPERRRFHYVVTFRAQPVGETATNAAIDQESHDPVSRTASKESLAITAWA
jgi:hypothetical protein